MDQTTEESTQIVSQLLQEKDETTQETIAVWPSGRTLQISTSAGMDYDSLMIRNPSGDIVLRLDFDEGGPRLVLPAGELRVKAGKMAFQAESMNFDVQKDVHWQVEGAFNIHSGSTSLVSANDTALNGRFIKLNCDQIPTDTANLQANRDKTQDS